MRPLPLTSLVLVLSAGLSFGCGPKRPRTTPPSFEEYPADLFTGAMAPLTYAHEGLRTEYGTQIEAMVRATGPTFAGHMAFAVVPCGEGCIVETIVDLRTGAVREPEGVGLSPLCVNLDLRPSSRLVIASPAHSGLEQPRDCPGEVRYWEWTGERFDSIPVRLQATTGS